MYSHTPQQPTQSGLPVPVDSPRDNGLWSENPFQDPNIPLPVVNITANFAWMVPMAVGALVNYLQSNCRAGAVSTFAYNLFSYNAYRNEQFAAISNECLEYVVYRVRSSNNPNLQEEVINAASSYCKVAVASCTTHFAQLLQYLPPIAAQDVQNVLAAWRQVKAQMSSQTASQALAHNGGIAAAQHVPHAGPGASLFGGASLVAAPSNDDGRGRGSYAHQRPSADGLVIEGEAEHVVEQPAAPDLNGLSFDPIDQQSFLDTPLADMLVDHSEELPMADIHRLDFDAGEHTSFAGGEGPDLDDIVDTVEAGYPEKDDPIRIICLTPSAFESSKIKDSMLPAEGEWIDQYIEQNVGVNAYCLRVVKFLSGADRPWDTVIAESMDESRTQFLLTPSILGSTKATRSAHQPLREFAYDPETHVLFHAMKVGTLEPTYEYIAVLEDSMKYLNHENIEALRQQESARSMARENIRPDWSALHLIEPRVAKDTPGQDMANMQKLDKKFASNKENEGLFDLEFRAKAVIIPKCNDNATIDDVLYRIDQYRRVNHIPTTNLHDCYEAYGTNRRRFLLREYDAGEVLGMVNNQEGKGGYIAWVEFLSAYVVAVGKDRFFNFANDLLASRMNKVLFYTLGITEYKSNSFLDDVGEMVEILRTYGANQLEAFTQYLDLTCSQLQMQIKDDCLELFTQFSVVYVEHTLPAMGFFPFINGRTDGAVALSTHRDLYQSLNAVMKRAGVMNNKQSAPVYVVASDGSIVQLHRSAWDGNYISVELLLTHDFT